MTILETFGGVCGHVHVQIHDKTSLRCTSEDMSSAGDAITKYSWGDGKKQAPEG